MISSIKAKTSPTAIGRAAESLAVAYLTNAGFTVLERNWHNRWCEIDVVARKSGRIHIIEVKYRRSTAYGTPTEYISHDKADRLMRAALAWVQAHSFAGPYQIDLIGVSGPLTEPQIEHLENVIEA